MQKTIYGFIFAHSLRQQILLLLLTISAFPFLYLSLELPKTIINEAINGRDFPKSIFGLEFDQIPYLMVLCVVFLVLVLVNGAFKYTINVWKGRLGERMLRRLRYELYSRVLRFPLPHFKRVSQGEIIPMITSEVEPVGGFIGDAVAQPVFQAGQLLTILAFILVQDPILGLAAVALYPFQGWLIPRLQRRVNMLGKERVRMVRRLSERIGESIAGVQEIRVNHGTRYNRAGFSEILGKIYLIRYEIFHRKFVIKFINNFIAQLTPFFFYMIGGYLVIKGDLSFGALVAVLAAYKDMSAPWKELLLFYQQKEDARIKYEQVIEQFEPQGMLDARLQTEEPDEIPMFQAADEVAAHSVGYSEEGGRAMVEAASFRFGVGGRVAILGGGGSGRDEVAMLLARLLLPVAGRITVAGRDLAHLPDAVVGRRIAYVGPSAYLFSASIRDNMLFGLKHRPLPGVDDGPGRRDIVMEALASGNPVDDVFSDWVDYEAAGIAGPDGVASLLIDVATRVGLESDLYHFG
ncbi:MAG: ABC transporter transmembrane domain-containing protein, partial [Alphaproteobacteria bacterium]